MKRWRRILALLLSVTLLMSLVSVWAADKQKVSSPESENVLAYAILGEKTETYGMRVWMGEVNSPNVVTKINKQAWELDKSDGSASRYIYVDIDDRLFSNRDDGSNLEVEVEYFDSSVKGSLAFEYSKYSSKNTKTKPLTWGQADVVENQITELDIFDFGGSNAWRKNTWFLPDAYGNNSVSGADFRFGVYSASMGNSVEGKILIHSIKVIDKKQKSQIQISSDETGYERNFLEGDKMALHLNFDTSKYSFEARKNGNYDIDVTYTLQGREDNKIYGVKTEKLTVMPDEITKSYVEFDADVFGLYWLIVEAENTDKRIYSREKFKCAYIRSTHGKIFNDYLGMNLTTGTEAFDLLKNTGFKHLRDPLTNPGAITKSAYGPSYTKPGEYALDVGTPQKWSTASKEGFTQQGWLGMPGTQTYASVMLESVDRGNGGFLQIPFTDEGRKNFLKLTLELMRLQHPSDGSEYIYQLGNEWDLAYPRNALTNSYDAGVLYQYCYPVIKEKYPDVMVIGPSATTAGFDTFWLNNFLASGAKNNLDALSIHPYNHVGEPIVNDIVYETGRMGDVSTVGIRKLLDSYGMEDVPIMFTEGSFASYNMLCHGAHQHSAWNTQQVLQGWEFDLCERNYFFQWTDGALNRAYNERNFGCLDYENVAKPILLSFANLNILFHDKKFMSRTDIVDAKPIAYRESYHEVEPGMKILKGDTVAYRFRKTETGEDLVALMSNAGCDDVAFDFGTNEITIYDMYGNSERILSPDGTYGFAVTEDPMYIVGNFTKYKVIEKQAIGVSNSLLFSGYETEIDINLFNNSNIEGLKVLAEAGIAGTETKVIKNEFDGNAGQIKLFVDPAPPVGFEPVRVKIFNDDGVYYSGTVYLSREDSVDIETEIMVDAETMHWYIKADITNKSDAVQNGVVKLYEPIEWMCEIPDVVLEPGEIKQITIPLPENAAESGGGKTAGIAFIVNEKGDGVYINEQVDFAYARKVETPPEIDGKLDDWTDEGWMYMTNDSQFCLIAGTGNFYGGESDLWARTAVRWDDENLYFATEVRDDYFVNTATRNALWSMDGIQLGILYDPDDKYGKFEDLALALANGEPQIYRHMTNLKNIQDSTVLNDYDLQITKDGENLYYELRISWKDLLIDSEGEKYNKVEEGEILKFGCIVNEADNAQREGYYFIADGGVSEKDASKFAKMFLLGVKK